MSKASDLVLLSVNVKNFISLNLKLLFKSTSIKLSFVIERNIGF